MISFWIHYSYSNTIPLISSFRINQDSSNDLLSAGVSACPDYSSRTGLVRDDGLVMHDQLLHNLIRKSRRAPRQPVKRLSSGVAMVSNNLRAHYWRWEGQSTHTCPDVSPSLIMAQRRRRWANVKTAMYRVCWDRTSILLKIVSILARWLVSILVSTNHHSRLQLYSDQHF